ncbi:5424_t:CDS:2, partial [Dentiscutata heterogama]
MKANKSTTPKDIADTPRLKRKTLPLLENNRSKENILCDTKKSSGHGEVKSTTRKVATTEMQIETGVYSTEQKENIQNMILEQILQRLNVIELRQKEDAWTLPTQRRSIIEENDGEHYIDIDIASSPNMLDRVNQVWGIIEEAIIKSAKQNLPNKKIRPSKRANLGKIIRDIKRAENPPNSSSVLQWNRGLEKINKSTGSEITLVTDFITESWLEEAKKEIRVCVERRVQIIIKKQKRMLTSLLEKSTSKVTIDRVYTEEAESARLETKPKE